MEEEEGCGRRRRDGYAGCVDGRPGGRWLRLRVRTARRRAEAAACGVRVELRRQWQCAVCLTLESARPPAHSDVFLLCETADMRGSDRRPCAADRAVGGRGGVVGERVVERLCQANDRSGGGSQQRSSGRIAAANTMRTRAHAHAVASLSHPLPLQAIVRLHSRSSPYLILLLFSFRLWLRAWLLAAADGRSGGARLRAMTDARSLPHCRPHRSAELTRYTHTRRSVCCMHLSARCCVPPVTTTTAARPLE